jgi:hypothetical protein
MTWASRVAKNLLPLSRKGADLAVALKEWRYTGNFYDLEEPSEDCELCDHPDIRYQFEIANIHTSHALLVGSECINRFDITALDEEGRELDVEASKRRLGRDRARLVDNARKRRIAAALVALGGKDSDFKIESFIDYLQSRGAFTPKQLALVFWRLDHHQIPYRANDYKLTIRRNREKAQLIELPDWQLQRLWPALTPSQRQFYAREKKRARQQQS